MTLALLFGATQGRLNEASEMTLREDLEPLNFMKQHRELSTCDPIWTCEGFLGYDGRIVHKQKFFLRLFGAGCVSPCVASPFLTLSLEFLGYDCGPCV